MAILKRFEEVEALDLSCVPGASGTTKRVLIGTRDGAPTFAVRLFTISPGGHTPRHSHPFEHGVLVLEGKGELLGNGGTRPLSAGMAVYVPPNEEHQFRNTGDEDLQLICIVPVHVEE